MCNVLEDLLCSWSDVVDWLSRTGLSANPSLNVPASRGTEALKKVVELRQAWKEKLAQIIAGNKVSDDFLERLNTLLAEDTFHETLHRDGKKDFSLVRSISQLDGEKLALAILARQIALFLAEGELELSPSVRQYHLMHALFLRHDKESSTSVVQRRVLRQSLQSCTVSQASGKGQKVKTASAATAASPCCTTCSRSHSIGATFTSSVS